MPSWKEKRAMLLRHAFLNCCSICLFKYHQLVDDVIHSTVVLFTYNLYTNWASSPKIESV
jgi:hypothetical protein